MTRHKELKVWQKSVDLSVEIYKVSAAFPKEEIFGLTSQLKRSAVSIPSNIAEGAGRNSPKEFNNFLGVSQGSLFELETQLMIANKVKFLSPIDLADLQEKMSEITKMIFSLQKQSEIISDGGLIYYIESLCSLNTQY